MKVLAVIQARFSSARLPGKVLAPILGKPMLQCMIERVQRSGVVDEVVVATSVESSDDELEKLCLDIGVQCHRGSLDDVLTRFVSAVSSVGADHVVRLTGDCPLMDAEVIDKTVQTYLDGDYDYVSNVSPPTFPDGLDVEVFSVEALETAGKLADKGSEREHVTPYIRNHPDLFRLGSFTGEQDLSSKRWTVDEPADLEFVRSVFLHLSDKSVFGYRDVVELLESRPELEMINAGFVRNEGMEKSLKQDRLDMLNMNKNRSVQERAIKRIPGMTQLLSKRPDLFSQGVWPTYFSKSDGARVWDLDDNEYIDMSIGGIGANVLGYCDPDVDRAVLDAVARGNSSSLNCEEEVDLADLLCEIHPWADMVRFARTGGESMAIAVRIARAATGRDKIAFCGYHGWHDWYLAANVGTENALGEHLIPGLSPVGVPDALKGTAFPFSYNDVDSLQCVIAEHGAGLAAIVMEPIRNMEPSPEFIEAVHAAAQEVGAVLVFDEISAGFRMNSGGSHLKLGWKPDIAVFSKALGNGYPIAAVIGKETVMDHCQKSFISSTYWTERIGFAAAIAMVKKHQKLDVGAHLMRIGEAVQQGWKTVAAKHGLNIHVGGIPPLSHFSFEHPEAATMKAFLIQEMLMKGYLASSSFYSMYTHTDEHVSGYLDAMDNVLEDLVGHLKNETLDRALVGAPSISGFARIN